MTINVAKKRNLIGSVVILSVAMAFGGCSSTPKPTAELAVSKNALAGAASAGGAEFAPVELKNAQDKVDRAERAMEADQNLEARRLAEEAAADAKYAETKALAAKAQKSLQESQEGQRALKEELQRQNNQ